MVLSPRLQTIYHYVYTYVVMTVGMALFAFGVDSFLIAHHMVSTGFSGIAIIIYYISNLPIGMTNIVLNIPVLFAAWKWLGKSYVVGTIYGTLMSSFLIDLFSFMAPKMITHDPIISAILAGITSGVGLGLVYRVGGNTGGLDPIAFIVRKYWGFQIGSITSAFNFLVLIGGAFVVGLEPAAYTLVNVFVFAYVSNRVVVGFSRRKAVFIISDKTQAVCTCIMQKMGRGATILHGEGAYTHQPKQVILAAVNLMQIAKLKRLVEEVDDKAFMLITDANEVIGAGFTQPLRKHEKTLDQILAERGQYRNVGCNIDLEIEEDQGDPIKVSDK